MFVVGITNYNYGHYLERAIDSALTQAHRIIVVDNASTDNSHEILAGYGDKIETVYHTSNTRSPVAGMNEIISLSAIDNTPSDVLLFLDADDVLLPGSARILQYAFSSGLYDWVFSDLYLADDEGNIVGEYKYEGFPTTAQEGYDRGVATGQLPVPMKGAFSVGWLKENQLLFSHFKTTVHAHDYATCMDWLDRTTPRILYLPIPLVSYRYHGNVIPDDERETLIREVGERYGGRSRKACNG